MKNFNRTLCAIFTFVAALAMGSCANPDIDENKKVSFNVTLEEPTPIGAKVVVTSTNVKEFAYISAPFDVDSAIVYQDGKKVKVTGNTMNYSIEGLDSGESYTLYFACTDINNEIRDIVVKIEFTTTSYGDNVLTVVERKYDGFYVHINMPDAVKERGNALRYSTSSMPMYNYAKQMGSMELDMLLYNAGQYTTHDALIRYDDFYSTERDENGEPIYDEQGNLNSASFADAKVPGEPGYFIVGEFGYMKDEEERLVYVDTDKDGEPELFSVNDGSYLENSIWWYPAGWKPGYYMPMYDWEEWIAAATSKDETYDTEKYWNGYYERIFVETLEPQVIENCIDITVTDKSPKDALVTFEASDEVLQYCVLMATESEYETQILPLLDGNEDYMRWMVSSYFSMMTFGVVMSSGVSDLWVSDWFVDTRGMAGQTIRVMVTGLCNREGTVQTFATTTFQLPEITLPKPEVVVTAVKSDDPYSFTFNIKNPNPENEITEAYFACNYAREFNAILDEYSYTSLLKEMGNELGSNEIEQINSEDGFTFKMSSRENATSRLAVLVYNKEGSSNNPDAPESAAVAEYTTPEANWPTRVNSDLFDALQGTWEASAPMKNYVAETDASGAATGKYVYEDAGTYTSEVTIMNGLPYTETVPQEVYDIYRAAKFTDAEIEELYAELIELTEAYNERTRGFNRLLCLGYNFANPAYLLGQVATPYDLFIHKDYSVSKTEYMFYDFGPKWNLEIDKDGKVWLPIDIEREFPLVTYNFGLDYTLYMLAVGEYTYLGGDLVDKSGNVTLKARFPVEVSDDRNTLTIKPIVYTDSEGTTEYYYPCVAQLSYGSATPVNPRVKGDVVLKRKVDAKSAVKANAPVAKSVSKAIPALGEAPVPMARPEYTMTSLDPAKMPVRKQLVLKNKIDPSEEAFHERATAAVKAYYGIK